MEITVANDKLDIKDLIINRKSIRKIKVHRGRKVILDLQIRSAICWLTNFGDYVLNFDWIV